LLAATSRAERPPSVGGARSVAGKARTGIGEARSVPE